MTGRWSLQLRSRWSDIEGMNEKMPVDVEPGAVVLVQNCLHLSDGWATVASTTESPSGYFWVATDRGTFLVHPEDRLVLQGAL